MFKFEDFLDKSQWNVLSLLKKRAADLEDKLFIEFDSGKVLTYKALEQQSNKLALKLISIGLSKMIMFFAFLRTVQNY
jgi:non-ribosomal peptide synthetase component E (peptide arylation enzyme)